MTLVVDVAVGVSNRVPPAPDICCHTCCNAEYACCAVDRLPDCNAWPNCWMLSVSFPAAGGTWD